VDARIHQRLGHLLDHVMRRRLVRIAHAEIDDVVTGRARLRLELVDLGKDVRRQALYAVEFVFHDSLECWLESWPGRRLTRRRCWPRPSRLRRRLS
jgi:hypothetical protein